MTRRIRSSLFGLDRQVVRQALEKELELHQEDLSSYRVTLEAELREQEQLQQRIGWVEERLERQKVLLQELATYLSQAQVAAPAVEQALQRRFKEMHTSAESEVQTWIQRAKQVSETTQDSLRQLEPFLNQLCQVAEALGGDAVVPSESEQTPALKRQVNIVAHGWEPKGPETDPAPTSVLPPSEESPEIDSAPARVLPPSATSPEPSSPSPVSERHYSDHGTEGSPSAPSTWSVSHHIRPVTVPTASAPGRTLASAVAFSPVVSGSVAEQLTAPTPRPIGKVLYLSAAVQRKAVPDASVASTREKQPVSVTDLRRAVTVGTPPEAWRPGTVGSLQTGSTSDFKDEVRGSSVHTPIPQAAPPVPQPATESFVHPAPVVDSSPAEESPSTPAPTEPNPTGTPRDSADAQWTDGLQARIHAKLMRFMHGKLVGQDLLDATGNRLAAKGTPISDELIEQAQRAGSLPNLILHMTLPDDNNGT